MILETLAPASNFVSSVTAALMPTLLGPAANLTPNKANLGMYTYEGCLKSNILYFLILNKVHNSDKTWREYCARLW